MKARSCLCLILLSATLWGQYATPQLPQPAPALDDLVRKPGIWQATPTVLEETFKTYGFVWTSDAKDSARASNPGLHFSGQRVWEAILRLPAGTLKDISLNFFNRGDAGDISERNFEKLITDVTAAISTTTGKAPKLLGRDASSAVRAESAVWETTDTRFTMEWSNTKESRVKGIPFRAEFVRLSITPKSEAPRGIAAATPQSQRDATRSFRGSDHITRTPDGDVKILDVPMVDQGKKGYCVVASAERLLRYFGANVDQHELAQIANSDAEKGTNIDTMVASLKKLTARLGVRTREIYDLNPPDFQQQVEDYNRLAKREKAPEVQTGGYVISKLKIYQQMNPDLLKQVRTKRVAEFGKFQREIQRSIDEGVPLLWSVILGVVPEKGLGPGYGGHMRLIIGYNTKTGEVIYSDSWGAGHEVKRMPMDSAWTISKGLSTIAPLQ